MSFQAMEWVLDNSQSAGSGRLVLLVIARHCGKTGDSAFPSLATLVDQAKVGRNTVSRVIDDLEALGEVFVYQHQGRAGMGGTTNRYELPLVPGWVAPRGLTRRKTPHDGTTSQMTREARSERKRRDLDAEVARSESERGAICSTGYIEPTPDTSIETGEVVNVVGLFAEMRAMTKRMAI